MGKIKSSFAFTVAAVVAMGASSGAYGSPFTFNPNGGGAGAISGVETIDWAPGSAVAVGGITAITNFNATGGACPPATPCTFELRYQARLSVLMDGLGNVLYADGLPGTHHFTIVAGFRERVVATGANLSASFAFDPTGTVNYVDVYDTGALTANNLTGQNFVVGSPILTGIVTSIPSSNFTVGTTTATTFDQGGVGGADNWGGQQTVSGSGASDLRMIVQTVNNGYFLDLFPLSSLVMAFFNNSQVTPFLQTDPSQCFNVSTGGPLLVTAGCNAGTGLNTVGTLGLLNGSSGPNIEFQADANMRFQVPEPGSLALLGLGLLAALGFGRFRRRVA